MLSFKSANTTTIVRYPLIHLQFEVDTNLSSVHFYIYRSFGSEDFKLLTKLPLLNATSFTDYTIPTKQHYTPLLYKIKAIDARAGLDPDYTGTEFEYAIENYIDVYTKLNKYDYLLYNEINRKNELLLKSRYSGVTVYLYKAKTYGVICTECANRTIKRPTQSRCQTCYGTGYVGGYYLPFTQTMANFIEVSPRTRRKADTGPNVPLAFQVGINLPPILDYNDLIYRPDSDEFYGIKSCKTLKFKESLPIKQTLAVFTILKDDVVYTLPRDISALTVS